MSLEEFRARYEAHVNKVAAGDTAGALADMVPARLATVFDGVTVPRGAVTAVEVRDVRAEGATHIGEAVYTTPDAVIGLRSIWENHDGVWLAAALENFPVEARS
ncbi:hypothetical protein [Nocardia higoensis]|uniref:hypothetical protein n=1 Tax=Nocardia higoensis TaxID=228599 RepID=UPI0002FE1A3A|nr:hypothetical protein [Nocardia higoensis]